MIEASKNGRRNILTVVVEDYFQVGAFRRHIPHQNWDRFATNLARDTECALALLESTNCRATFFCSGWVGANHPRILRRIAEQGHEVACQGYFHYHLAEVSRDDFAQDIRRSRLAVEDATGQSVRGFRIGRGWFGRKDLWALDVLAEAGFAYDSSVRLPRREGWRSVHHHETAAGSLYEVPPTTLPVLGQPLLLSGGNYLRQFPDRLLHSAVDSWMATCSDPLVLYFHSWELGSDQPRIGASSWHQRLRHYRNLEAMPGKLRYYLERYDFTSIAEHLDLAMEATTVRAVDQQRACELVARAGLEFGRGRVALTLVIPCCNEAETLAYLERTLRHFAERSTAFFDLHYILVDDGSTDDTWTLLQELFGGRDRFTLLQHGTNRGIAAALITGFRQVRTEYLAALDADCTFDPEQLVDMMPLMKDEIDVVAASPMHAQGRMHTVPVWRALLSRGASLLYRCILRNKLTSYTSCFRLYRRRVIEGVNVADPGFCGVTEILGRLDLAGCRIAEYPARLETRVLGRSKIKVVRTILGHLKLAARLAMLRWFGRPLPGPADMRASYADAERE